MRISSLLFAPMILMSACEAQLATREAGSAAPSATQAVTATAETAATRTDAANDPAILINGSNPAKSRILGSSEQGGIELYSLSGERLASADQRPATLVDVRYNFAYMGQRQSLVISYDAAAAELVAYVTDGDSLRQVSAPMPTEAEIEGLCLYVSPISGKYYAFAAGEGMLQQWELHTAGEQVRGRLIRSVPVGPGAAHCAASDRQRVVYYSQETVGVARLNAEPESEAEVEYIGLAQPHGVFEGDIKGVALYEQGDSGYLLVSDADVNRVQVYDLDSHAHLGAIRVTGSGAIDDTEETEGMAAVSLPLSDAYPQGMLVVADDDNSGEPTNYKLVSWSGIAAALELPVAAAYDPTVLHVPTARTVSPSNETVPVRHYGDAADDPLIWVHPEDPAKSLVIGTQKKRGINVYDMKGALVQEREDGRINNADIRYGFMLGGEAVDIVAGSNRTHDSISVWRIDKNTRQLVDIADGILPTGMTDPYGLCMYRSPRDGSYYVFVNDTDGVVRQWRLAERSNGRVALEQVREFKLDSQTEGCVADDETGDLYVGEEDVGIWKYSAEPDGGDRRRIIDRTDGGNLTDDVEGLAILYGEDGAGYLIASNQGADNYAIYERQGDNRFLGLFYVVADEETGIDGSSETDGLDVTSANLGPQFPHGMLVVQDGRNIAPKGRQNFKMIPWERIAAAMGLEVYSGYDPRATAQ